jgi:hypothetical protein
MTTPTPTWNIEWRGDPSGFPRHVHVFFMADSAPTDSSGAGMELARGLEQATTEGLFNNALLAFAERTGLRVVSVYKDPSHTYPAGDVITVTFEREKPLSINVEE